MIRRRRGVPIRPRERRKRTALWTLWSFFARRTSNHIHSYLAVVTVSCFVRGRVPRTKSEIEANSKRKELLKNFKVKLKNLKAAELDELDYRKGKKVKEEKRKLLILEPTLPSALEKLREEFRADNESLAQSEAISIMSLCDELPRDDKDAVKEAPPVKMTDTDENV